MSAGFGLGVDKVIECASCSILHCNHLKYAQLLTTEGSTHHCFVLQKVFIILDHIGVVQHGQHFDLVENALTICSRHHVHWNLFQDHLARGFNVNLLFAITSLPSVFLLAR